MTRVRHGDKTESVLKTGSLKAVGQHEVSSEGIRIIANLLPAIEALSVHCEKQIS